MFFGPPMSALDATPATRKMRPSISRRSSPSNVPKPRSHRNTVARHHCDHHHRPAEEGAAERLAARIASVAAGTEAAGWRSVHAAFRARAGGPGNAGILVFSDLDPYRDRGDAG